MPRSRGMGRRRYMIDRAMRRGRRSADRSYYPMDYARSRSERSGRDYNRESMYRPMAERGYMEYEQPREYYRDYNYDMRGDYRRGRDYADDDYDKEYDEDLHEWIKELKKSDRYGLSKEEVVNKAKDMGVKFDEYDEEEYYAIYLMHVSDYPFIANEPHTYLAMAKAWLEDKDLEIDPSEKVCRYMYEIAMAED